MTENDIPDWLVDKINERIAQLNQADKPAISHARIKELERVLTYRKEKPV